jgi:seryl-tRNA synthetase
MLDINHIRAHPDEVREGLRRKGSNQAVLDELLALDTRRRTIRQTTEQLQAELNARSTAMATVSSEEREALRAELRALSERVSESERGLNELEAEFLILHRQIPNLPDPEVPDGSSDKENVVVRTEGARPAFSFTPLDHETLALRLDLLDMERGAKVAGQKFYYLKNELVILEQAVLRWALDIARAHGFTPLTVPHLARKEAFYGAGHFATVADAEEGDAYRVERDDLYLAGTAEVGLVNYHAGEVLAAAELSRRYVGISPCYRREAGTYGKETRGLYRVHQFQKVELVSLVQPQDSPAEHVALLTLAEELLQLLGLHYQVVLNCAGDLGHPQAKKWDIESWLPGMDKFGETHSCSNDTDWQARALNIRFRDAEGLHFVHTLNNTLLASPRILVAILENYQQEDGSVRIPDVLVPYTGFTEIRKVAP